MYGRSCGGSVLFISSSRNISILYTNFKIMQAYPIFSLKMVPQPPKKVTGWATRLNLHLETCTYMVPISRYFNLAPDLVTGTGCQPIKRTMNNFLGFVFHCSVSESYTSKRFIVTCNNFSGLKHFVNCFLWIDFNFFFLHANASK